MTLAATNMEIAMADNAAGKAVSSINVDRQLDYCSSQVEKSLASMKRNGVLDYSLMPKDIQQKQKSWSLQTICPENWTCGFWPGVLWMDYAYTKDENVKREAVNYTLPLARLAAGKPYDHDLGFLIFLSYEKAFQATGEKKYKDVILETANKLAELFNPKVGTILSWPREAVGNGRYKPHNTIIDNMINLEMLFWAADNGGDRRLRDIAIKHADTTMKNHFRPDHTCYHVAVYDTLTGHFIKGKTNQGCADSSVWSRGQAWAIYGYTMCYRKTKDKKYLEFAQKVTDAYLKRLPDDYIPYWDFCAPDIPNAPRDASAASAVASGLLELCTYVDGNKRNEYFNAAKKMLQSLSSQKYKSGDTNTAFLLHSTGNYPINSQIDCSIIYADYYYMEALLRLKEIESTAQLASPDGKYKVTFCQRSFGDANRMLYSVDYDGETIIGESELGVEISNRLAESALGIPNDSCAHWGDNLKVIGIERASRDTIWTPLYGEDSQIADRYNSLTIKMRKGEDSGVASENGYDKRRFYYMNVEMRAYNEGIALRYHFPEATNGLFIHITDELTSFTLPNSTTAWHERWAQAPHKKIVLDQWQGESERPLLLQLPSSTYVAIGEARLTDFVRGKIDATNDTTLKMSLYESADIITPYDTPWRVVMAGKKAVDLINHKSIFLNLNDPCQIADTRFIRCGKAFRISQLKRDAIYKGIDFAAERGFQFVELDAGWYGSEAMISSKATKVASTRNFDIADICDKAEAKGLGVWLYVNQRALYTQLDSILPLYKQWGVAGIKFGFVQVGNQQWTTWLHNAVRKCAEYGLMVDIHDEYRPTGFSRTYPNLLTQEGVHGNEEMPDADNNTILPFTRFLCGPADYTLCYFNNRVKNTKAHQLAMAVVYYSPLQFMMWYDSPRDFKGEAELKFWADVPTIWDESIALDGEPGEYIVQARRSGNDWYLGALTNTSARKITIDTSRFLKKGKTYSIEIYSDDTSMGTRTNVASTSIKKFKAGKPLGINLQNSGGVAMRFLHLF